MQRSDISNIDWNTELRRQFLGQSLARLPHATLLIGPSGVGKVAFAEQVAALLLCESPSSPMTACGECDSCRWLVAGNHPDFRRVAPDDEGAAETGQALLSTVDAIVFTGSVATGRQIAVAAAERFIPAFLELGGKDPAVVLAGSDIERAATSILRSALDNVIVRYDVAVGIDNESAAQTRKRALVVAIRRLLKERIKR